MRYTAWGEVRYNSGVTPTDYTYTGQYSYTADFGLMFYNARWYDPALGRFAQADTILPDQYNPQSWDRYAYSYNNPILYTDPSGHDPNPWLPWEFNTIVVQIAINLEAPLGINVNLEGILDIKSLKEYEFDIYDIKSPKIEGALAVSATETVGIQAEGATIGSVYGTNETVNEIINNNVSSLLTEPTLPAHLEVCVEWCFGAGYNFDPADPNWSAGESVSYSFGYGAGVSIGLDVAEARDWVVHYSPGTGLRTQRPTRFKEYFDEASEDFWEIIPY